MEQSGIEVGILVSEVGGWGWVAGWGLGVGRLAGVGGLPVWAACSSLQKAGLGREGFRGGRLVGIAQRASRAAGRVRWGVGWVRGG